MKDDHLKIYGIWIIQIGMLLLQFNNTEKEGDGDRTITLIVKLCC
jgi:hypothetical protein